jgi:AraC-like DNA-binding protein
MKLAFSDLPVRPCGYHAVDRDATFEAHDCVCGHDARTPTIAGAYARAKIGVMLVGGFHARSREGSVVVGPGTLLLGNAGAEYEYRHLDDGGDRSLGFTYEASLLDELGAAGFRRASIPPSPATAPAVALAHQALCTGDPEAVREAALAVAAAAIAAQPDVLVDASPDQRPILAALRYIDAHHAADCSLATLAAHARLSPFHFLRRFRAATGQTPRQAVIAARLRAAATQLRSTRAPILDIALAVGFNDLSHFTTTFTRAFGRSPGRYRAAG